MEEIKHIEIIEDLIGDSLGNLNDKFKTVEEELSKMDVEFGIIEKRNGECDIPSLVFDCYNYRYASNSLYEDTDDIIDDEDEDIYPHNIKFQMFESHTFLFTKSYTDVELTDTVNLFYRLFGKDLNNKGEFSKIELEKLDKENETDLRMWEDKFGSHRTIKLTTLEEGLFMIIYPTGSKFFKKGSS